MKEKYYLMIKNKVTCIMEKVAVFESLGDALKCCTLFNNELNLSGESSKEYFVTDNPMIYK